MTRLTCGVTSLFVVLLLTGLTKEPNHFLRQKHTGHCSHEQMCSEGGECTIYTNIYQFHFCDDCFFCWNLLFSHIFLKFLLWFFLGWINFWFDVQKLCWRWGISFLKGIKKFGIIILGVINLDSEPLWDGWGGWKVCCRQCSWWWIWQTCQNLVANLHR